MSSFLFSFCLLSVGFSSADQFDPPAVYLTWRGDPATTMLIRWHSNKDENRSSDLMYQQLDESTWHSVQGSSHPMAHSNRTIHLVELAGLTPNTKYRFRPGEDATEFKFQTMPATADAPIRFIVGGDMYGADKWFNRVNPRDLFGVLGQGRYSILRETNRQAASQDPRFVVIGGDITYSNGKPDRFDRWYRWLAAWKEDMVTSDGLLIPLLPAIGNHEVRDNTYREEWHSKTPYDPAVEAPFFYSLFVHPDTLSYKAVDFRDYLSIILLDSGHTNFVRDQNDWLSQTLESRSSYPHLFAAYHVPAYPSYRNPLGRIPTKLRKNWIPLFEKFGLDAAFEHHDHTYKRTHPIRNGKVHPEGVIYLGDGAWGRLRSPKKARHRWYLAHTAKEFHFILVEIQGHRRTFSAINEEGELIDKYPTGPAIEQAR
jgi:hypothetical protein